MIKMDNQGGRQAAYLSQAELMTEMQKFDDQLYLEEGFRKEHLDNAIEAFGLQSFGEEEAPRQRPMVVQMGAQGPSLEIAGTDYRESGKQIILN